MHFVGILVSNENTVHQLISRKHRIWNNSTDENIFNHEYHHDRKINWLGRERWAIDWHRPSTQFQSKGTGP